MVQLSQVRMCSVHLRFFGTFSSTTQPDLKHAVIQAPFSPLLAGQTPAELVLVAGPRAGPEDGALGPVGQERGRMHFRGRQ